MKKILSVLLVVMSISVYSQDYFPLPDENAVWSINNEVFEPDIIYKSVLFTDGDTIINDLTYIKITQQLPDWYNYNSQDTISRLFALFRQDSLERKVFVIRLFIDENTEKLIYHFDENATMPISLPGLVQPYDYPGGNENDSLFNLEDVTEVTLYDGTLRKKYRYRSIINDWIMYEVIESIGSENNPFGPGFIPTYPDGSFQELIYLSCLTKNDTLKYVSESPEDCGEIGVGTSRLYNQLKQLKNYPNPANSLITFELPLINIRSSLYIQDIFGKSIAEHHLNIGQTQLVWDCSSVSRGVYFYRTEINEEVYKGKIVVN